MYGLTHLPRDALCDVQVFYPNSAVANVGWDVWRKRPGCSVVSIFVIGGAGGGGIGVVGAASTAAGGGGGGSGAQMMVVLPAIMLPDALFVSVGVGGAATGSGVLSRVAIGPNSSTNDQVAVSNAGAAGGNGAGAVGGTAGVAGAASTASNFSYSAGFPFISLAGQNGGVGGATVSAAALTLPITGLRLTGGTGGGGLPAAAAVGTAGGAYTVNGSFPAHSGGIGGTAATVPPTTGSNGYIVFPKWGFFYGGTGGGSSHGTALTTGLFGGLGGVGGIGCGGGGGGGALTGSVQGTGGAGGGGLVIITAW